MSAADEHTIMLEIIASGDPAVLRHVVESYADALMARLVFRPEVVDPSIMLSVHKPEDYGGDEVEMVVIGGDPDRDEASA